MLILESTRWLHQQHVMGQRCHTTAPHPMLKTPQNTWCYLNLDLTLKLDAPACKSHSMWRQLHTFSQQLFVCLGLGFGSTWQYLLTLHQNNMIIFSKDIYILCLFVASILVLKWNRNPSRSKTSFCPHQAPVWHPVQSSPEQSHATKPPRHNIDL